MPREAQPYPAFGARATTAPTRRRILGGLAGLAVSGLAGCGVSGPSGAQGVPPGTRGRAALLLPLTGDAARLGQSMRQAASLGGTGVGLTAELEILDSGGSEESAVRAARAAVEAGARMLIGPLFSAQAAAVAAAVPKDVPVVALSNDEALADTGAFVFGVTPRHSAQAILGYAAARGLRDVAVVVPPGAFGTRSAEAAQALAKPLGITLRPTLTRAEAGGLRAALEAGGAGLPKAVYLPAADATLLPFAQALAGSGVQILGSVQWSGFAPVDAAELQGSWFAAPDPLRFEPFAQAFAREAGADAEAGILAGLTFDGAEMARLLGRIGVQNREGLLREAGFSGVLGPYRFVKEGLCQRGLAVLGVEGSQLTLLSATVG